MCYHVLSSSERNTDFLGYGLKCAKNVKLNCYNRTYFLSWTSILTDDTHLTFIDLE